ncbi:TspO/MBR family protein [Cryptosporangium phraense]|uniref:Tryptophan-rich sensory protein n=1 Tax=Cryptosporangium phraense TaxID=2593070 RepID=A0A545AIC6_9ACTN|nr:TspO/MBR family protein [Cryptosporangium phraense]TQS41069.1 tryptophan-rich sensory protein [Cryptosporangium phraense]
MVTPRAARPTNRWLALAGFLAAAFAAAAVGGLASVDAGEYYDGLDRPAWAPPAGVFGPVWTVLYTLIAIAGWLAWRRSGPADPAAGRPSQPVRPSRPSRPSRAGYAGRRTGPFGLYAGQLVLNAAWTWLFFAGEQPGLAFAEIAVLWAVILANAAAFARIRTAAGALLVPYLLWVTYAAALNLALWLAN